MGFELDRVHGGAVTSASEQCRSETILGEDGARGGGGGGGTLTRGHTGKSFPLS